jgi:hypothetical protein
MEGGRARMEIVEAADKHKRKDAVNIFRLPPLEERMTRMSVPEETSKVVSRHFMLDKLEEIGKETWAGEGPNLPSQAIHRALGRNMSW